MEAAKVAGLGEAVEKKVENAVRAAGAQWNAPAMEMKEMDWRERGD